MTPLHILSLNPHASTECIMLCFNANMNALFVMDMMGKRALDYLRVHNLDGHTAVMASLCTHRDSMGVA